MRTTIAKVTATVAMLALLALGSAACSSESTSSTEPADASQASETEEVAPEAVDLVGEWKQTNANSEDNFQTATITADTIEVYWNAPDTTSLYWAGTVEQGEGDSFTWDSANDTEQTASAMMASSDDTKTFTYENGEISYEVTALGTTMTVRLEKQ